MSAIRSHTLNFDPQHPAAHGALRLVLALDGEVVRRADLHIGMLHRGAEKLAESRAYIQALPCVDGLDYCSPMCNGHACCLAIEKLLGLDVPLRAQYIRVMFSEIARILNHLTWLGLHGNDCGFPALRRRTFREREDLLDMYEAAAGARLHAGYFCVGGVCRDLPDNMPQHQPDTVRGAETSKNRQGSLLDFVEGFAGRFPKCVDDYETLLTDNRIWKQRTVGMGVVSAGRALNLGLTGPLLRGAGVAWDLRKKQPYDVYARLDFDIPIGAEGDCYDRYLVRMQEMRESNRIIRQCVDWLRANPGSVTAEYPEDVPPGEAYAAVEHPKGEFGVYLVSDGASTPYRMKIRPPGFTHLAAFDELSRGHMLADAVAILGSLDIALVEIDR